uniref:Fibroblast activation protein alpha n=1 Tax=Chelonoidis abingdonii TaxID=106734 RepID=A0A8C0GG36_CHEAB
KKKWIRLAAVLLITLSSLYLISKVPNSDDNPRALTLEDYLNGKFQYKTFFPYWISSHEYLHQTAEDNIILYDVETEDSATILSNDTLRKVNASNYALSSDKQFIILESNSHFNFFPFFFFFFSNFVTENPLPNKIQYISWSPVGHKLAYVYKNNIFLKLYPEDRSIKITSNGKENVIFNGIPDWVYEEEMLGAKYALWWSPNGKFIAYVEFNDTDIPVIEYSYYGEDQYPRKITIPYPKAGAKNPTVRVFIVDTTKHEGLVPKEVPVPAVIASSDHYFTWLTWVTDNRIGVQWLKRIQNFSVLAVCDFQENSNSWYCPEVLHIEIYFFVSTPYFTSDTTSYYKIFSDKAGYKHIHYINGSVENAIPITNGQWEAIYIFRVTDDAIFYSSNEFEGYPGRRNIYKISIGSNPLKKQCITCNLRKERCQYYTARFSENAKYYALVCYGKYKIKVLEDNWELESAMENIRMPKIDINKLEVDGITLWYKMLLPPQFDRSKKYPLLIQVYGGPCSQNVKHTFEISWITYLASREEIIVVLVDGRGTAFQGDEMLYAVYRKLGVYEIEDQISAVKKFIEMGFVDEKRIAIWGWSYGGYVTSLALGSGSGVFKCGMAVAPCSFFPEQNSTVMARAENFRNVEYLLIHGTADDNVHFQNSAQISKALVNAQVDFQAMWYTDQDHGIPGLSSKHLYTHMTHFLKQCFFLSE